MDFVTVSTGLILPYWMGLPIRYIQLDSFYTYFSDFYTLSRFQKKIMKAYKKMIYLENYVLLKIFFD